MPTRWKIFAVVGLLLCMIAPAFAHRVAKPQNVAIRDDSTPVSQYWDESARDFAWQTVNQYISVYMNPILDKQLTLLPLDEKAKAPVHIVFENVCPDCPYWASGCNTPNEACVQVTGCIRAYRSNLTDVKWCVAVAADHELYEATGNDNACDSLEGYVDFLNGYPVADCWLPAYARKATHCRDLTCQKPVRLR